MHAGTALIQFEQGYQFTKNTRDIAPVDFINDKREAFISIFFSILAKAFENTFT